MEQDAQVAELVVATIKKKVDFQAGSFRARAHSCARLAKGTATFNEPVEVTDYVSKPHNS